MIASNAHADVVCCTVYGALYDPGESAPFRIQLLAVVDRLQVGAGTKHLGVGRTDDTDPAQSGISVTTLCTCRPFDRAEIGWPWRIPEGVVSFKLVQQRLHPS
jgi:hypothetical protein